MKLCAIVFLLMTLVASACRFPQFELRRPASDLAPTAAPQVPPASDTPIEPLAQATSATVATLEPTVTTAPLQLEAGTYQVGYQSGSLELEGTLCIPPGTGPFPTVVYNHGGLREEIGGAPEGQEDLQRSLSEAAGVSAPVLILVAENDVVQANHVQLSRMV